MANALDLSKRLSGGAANSDPNLSIGGAMSSTVIGAQTTTALTNITGVVFADANGNNDGTGTLTYNATGDTFTWQGAADTVGTAVTAGSDGTYVIYSGTHGYVAITVTYASLPVGNASDTVTIGTPLNNIFDDISKTESFVGDTEYRCFYLTNTHGSDSFFGVGVYIALQPTGDDSWEIGLDPAGMNGTATTPATEGDAPAGVTFSSPNSGSPLNIGQMDPADYHAVWIKRTIPALSSNATANDRARLGIVAFA